MAADGFVEDLPVHDASPDDDALGGHSQSHIQTQLGQVEPDDVPDLVIILDLMELNEFHLRSL